MRKIAVLVVAMGMLVGMTPSASAHWLSTDWQWVHHGRYHCQKAYDELSHDDNSEGGRYYSSGEAYGLFQGTVFTSACSWPTDRKQAVKHRAWAWDGYNWYVCFDDDWYIRSDQRIWSWTSFNNHAPCGTTWYTSDGAAYGWHNSQWKGGWVAIWDYSSEYAHYLPA